MKARFFTCEGKLIYLSATYLSSYDDYYYGLPMIFIIMIIFIADENSQRMRLVKLL